jgi:EAL domain-containing protein (putative c-di-GMP-specific phosphodiesterase class I)/ActR/RegA family two-component response regulator
MAPLSSRLLAIDDEPAFGRLIKRAAESMDFVVEATQDPHDFTAQARLTHPDVIVMDLKMPGVDGVQLLRNLAADRCSAHIILASGSDSKVLETAMRLGRERGLKMHGVLPKPLRLEDLRHLLEEFRPVSRAFLANELAEAITSDQLFLEYQPKLDLHKGSLTSVEALVRWRHPQYGLIRPDQFIGLAEETDLICRLTDWVVANAFVQVAQWSAANLQLEVAVNISARDLSDPDLPDRLVQHCRAAGIEPSRVTLELTETGAMREAVQMMDALTRLRIAGFSLSIDDFGTGYSSLVQLQKMPFSEIKVDREFVMQMARNDDCKVIVELIIELGRRLGLRSVAEGVEDAVALEVLAGAGCDFAQGYHLSKPIPADRAAGVVCGYSQQNAPPEAVL